MKINELRPIMWTMKLDETISFYTSKLGFTLDEKNDEWGWASLSKDGVGIMFAKPQDTAAAVKANFTGSFYFNVDDVEIYWNTLKDQANICYPIETFEWGMREFALFDNNGYVLQFGQDITL